MKISLLLFSFFSVQTLSFAETPLSYQCEIYRTNSHDGSEKLCGNLKLSIDQDDTHELPLCGAKITGGAAIATKGRVVMVALGTHASAHSGLTEKDATSIAFYPESAPKDFILTFLPNSTHLDSLVAECTR